MKEVLKMPPEDIKYCKRCKKAFDIDTSQDYCPDCRNTELNEKLKECEGRKDLRGWLK